MALQFDLSRLSHAYIIFGASRDDTLAAARHIAAAAICSGSDAEKSPCGVCRACRKVMSGIHPDVITVSRYADDTGKQKRDINVDQIRAISSDVCILPNEASKKVYIVDEADLMNIPAQNASLKLLEEPPNDALILLCVTNTSQLLPTVRSRCVEISCQDEQVKPDAETAEISCAGKQAEPDDESAKLAMAYLKLVAAGDKAGLFAWSSVGNDMEPSEVVAFVEAVRHIITDMLCARHDNPGLSSQELMHLSELAGRCLRYLRVNTGVKHIFGLLAVDSLPGGGKRG